MGSGIVQLTANGGDNGGSIEEGSPLLGDRFEDDEIADNLRRQENLRKRLVVPILFTIVVGLDFSLFMLNLPLTRVYESIACYRYYEGREPSRFLNPGSIPESLCKVEAVQSELAIVRGYEYLFQGLPGQ
ncbi:hypothetical protein PT974_05092 [Cladobotryum mycophilum]|uniref:Uncharacterized protein n=1 Tax=Cladobotryum mycophilum TaxID=491253 RepID=A0ABR0SR65_9HYPO